MTTSRATLAVALAVLAGTLAACAPGMATPPSTAAAPPTAVPSPTATAEHGEWPPDGEVEQPPPFEVRYAREALLLHPFTFCHADGCADGADPHPPSVGSAPVLFVHVPVAEFTELTVAGPGDAGDAGDAGDPGVEVASESLGDGWWRVRLTGPAGEHRLSLFAGSDTGAGDMVAEVLWTGGR